MNSVNRPLLGISVSNAYVMINRLRDRQHRLMINDEYLKLAIISGFTPVLLPYSENPASGIELLSHLDGLLLSGGADLDPAAWQENVTIDYDLDGFRTRAESSQLSRALRLKLPVFGICRGLQQINVYFGGTLLEDIPSQCREALEHLQTLPGDIPVHQIDWQPDSWCGSVIGTSSTPVNSFHHQAVEQAGSGVIVTGRSPDGIIEAIECETESFVAAVQFHPERMPHSPVVRELMRGFYDVCQSYQRERHG